MRIYFYKTTEIIGSNYVKVLLRLSAILNTENDDKYCCLWPKLASLQPCNKNHPNRVSNYRQNSNKLNIQGFDFSDEFKCSDVHEFEALKKLFINIIELKLYQNQKEGKHKMISIEISKNNSDDKVIDLLIYNNHYVLIKKLHVFSGKHDSKYSVRDV